MHVKHLSTITCGIALVASIGLGSGMGGAQDGSTLKVSIISGTCADPGEVVHELRDAVPSTGTEQGSMEAVAVWESETEIRANLDSLIADAHAIVVGDPSDPQACGDIGGVVDKDRDLSIGLAPLNTPDAFGIAQLDGDDDGGGELEVTVYVAVPAN